MARFQALTNPSLERDLDLVRSNLGLGESHKAELLREMAALAAWILRQSARGMTIEARSGKQVVQCDMPAVTRLREKSAASMAGPIVLCASEMKRLAKVLDEGFKPTDGLRKALANLASPDRKPPAIRWKDKAR
jgi:hypothetical protein